MPPKKPAATQPNKKTEQKKKEKVIEDKTFGLKNKKGAKQQKFIKHVEVQVKQGNVQTRKAGPTEQEKVKALKEKKEKEKEELNLLFKPVQQTVGKGVDPKSVLCSFFKQGTCTKGEKCKFSHDLNIHRKVEKRSMYEDTRDGTDEDTMANWDLEKLAEVVETKMGKTKQPSTTIICKFFLDAVEKSVYGWFWECPNGEKCIYKHCLPPGYVLKKDVKKTDKESEVSLEELIERERASLGSATTKVTLETFMKWKERKKREKIANAQADDERKKNEFKMGKMSGISGRQMFEFNPDLVDDGDAEDGAVMTYVMEEEDEEEQLVADIDGLNFRATENDNSGTIADPSQRLAPPSHLTNGTAESNESDKLGAARADGINHIGGGDNTIDESDKLGAACADGINHIGGGDDTTNADVVIDEDLFMDEDLDDLDDLDDDDEESVDE